MEEAASVAVDFRLLGPVEAVRHGEAMPLGGPRQRELLALLLLEVGRTVSSDRLADELWAGQPPAGVATTIRSYVSRLRTVLGDDAEIARGSAGYRLDVPRERIDAVRFERLTREGEDALARGAAERAADLLEQALSLWRGRPFGELGSEGALRLEAERLEELRLRALEQRFEADLALGRSGELVDELEALVHEHPYRERLRGQLMLALYRAGRQAEALDAYRQARAKLDEELGLEPGEELKRLEQAILRQEVEAVKPPEQRHNLPAQVTSFVGREHELGELEQLLRDSRLVTLTGVGGAGKTRLALELAARALPDYPGGAVFIDLSPIAEPALVARQVAAALDVREQPGVPIASLIVDRVHGPRPPLLLVDNCEHVRNASAELVGRLLTSCPDLRILATSREALGVPGEVDYPVPPLALPPFDADDEELRSSEAVSLFLARARAARPSMAEDADTVLTAAAICADLDGLPLAIELAAARAKALSLPEIAGRLSDRFRFLVSWRRVAPARHRTLREAIDWSYDLLAEDEQTLLDRLAVFAGAFSLEAVAAVCLDGDVERTLDVIEHLVEASLVVAEERGGEMRYRLLETVRQYAAEHLGERGKTARNQARHAEYFSALLDELQPLQTSRFDEWVERVAGVEDNVRAALTWSRDTSEPETLMRLVKQMWRFWWVRGSLSEGRGWLEDALEVEGDVVPSLRAEALEGAAGLAWASDDLPRAQELAAAGKSLYASVGDRRGESACLTILGHVAISAEDFEEAERLFQATLELGERFDDPNQSQSYLALAFHNLASVSFLKRDYATAVSRYERARSLYDANDDRYGVALSDLFLGRVAIDARRYADAAELLGRALPTFHVMGFRQYSTQCIEAIAVLLAVRGETREAVRLMAGADAVRDRIGEPPGGLPGHRAEVLDQAETELGEDEFAAAWAEGRALSEAEVLERAQAAVAG